MPKRLLSLRDGLPLLDLSSYARRGPNRRDRLSPAQVEQVARTVRRVPEVMVKVSGGGTSSGAVAAHFRYIDRRGQLEIETDDGEPLRGKGVEQDLVKDWDLQTDEVESRFPYGGNPGRRPGKLVHNIVLSMPMGTSPDKLLAASRAFAREEFALKHRYAMVLHTDQNHPHVHLVVKAMSEQGERLNIRKANLREWRHEFARHLRDHGVAANATERAVRGESRTHKTDRIYRAERHTESTHTRERAEAVADELLNGGLRIEPGKSQLVETRKEVEHGWRAINDILISQGQSELAAQVTNFVNQMPPAWTEKEWIAQALREHARPTRDLQPSR